MSFFEKAVEDYQGSHVKVVENIGRQSHVGNDRAGHALKVDSAVGLDHEEKHGTDSSK